MYSFSKFLPLSLIALAATFPSQAQTPAPAAPHTHSHAADEPIQLENYVVSATPFRRDQAELAATTHVLSGGALAQSIRGSLGETLADQPGISATSFGPGASRPVIRGLGNDRVLILTNGSESLDASVTSPDHAVAIDPLLADRIEVVRGPATLLYGGSAIGGLVNTLDPRLPRELPASADIRLRSRFGTAAEERAGAFTTTAAAGNFVWHADAAVRRTDDLRINGFADPADPVNENRLTNSATDSHTFGGSLSYFGQPGRLGLAASSLETTYGVVAEPDVTIELEQRRLDTEAELARRSTGPITSARLRVGFADYEHRELEGSDIGTIFKNRGFDARLEVLHEKLLGALDGAWGLQAAQNKLEAIGDEAFLPPSRTRTLALFAFEEMKSGAFTHQFGARGESQKIRPDSADTRSDETLSASYGLVFAPSPARNFAVSLSHSERAPNAQELFSDGPHVGTNAYEIGDPTLPVERALGLELTARQRTGPVTGALSLFAQRFNNFIYENPTGAQDPVDGLDIYQYIARDVDFLGGELEAIWHLHESKAHTFDLRATADLVRARDPDTKQNLPRITPRRATLALDYRGEKLTASLAVQGVDRARHLAANETPTSSYTLVHASVGYCFQFQKIHCDVFLRGSNLTNRAARNHVSFLKDLAPLPGRDVTLGVDLRF